MNDYLGGLNIKGDMRKAEPDEAVELDLIYSEKYESVLFGKRYAWGQVSTTGQWRISRVLEENFNVLGI